MLNLSMAEGGFASRILFINQKERSGKKTKFVEEDDWKVKPPSEVKKKLIEDLIQISNLGGRYKTLKGFGELFMSYGDEFNDKAAEGGIAKSYYSRKLWHCVKLAQILAADESNDLILSPKRMEEARAIIEDIEPEMYSAFAATGENKSLPSLVKVWEIMRAKTNGIWKRQPELSNAVFKHANPSQLDEHIRQLIQMGKIRILKNDNGETHCQIIDKSPLSS